MAVEFSAHNIRLDDGSLTRPETGYSMETYPWFVSSRRLLETVFPGDRTNLRLADLGCLEGGYAVEFARMGFNVLGIEVRAANLAACNYVKSKTNLPNLSFVEDDAWNIAKHGMFDVTFCCGLLYHFDRPREQVGLEVKEDDGAVPDEGDENGEQDRGCYGRQETGHGSRGHEEALPVSIASDRSVDTLATRETKVVSVRNVGRRGPENRISWTAAIRAGRGPMTSRRWLK